MEWSSFGGRSGPWHFVAQEKQEHVPLLCTKATFTGYWNFTLVMTQHPPLHLSTISMGTLYRPRGTLTYHLKQRGVAYEKTASVPTISSRTELGKVLFICCNYNALESSSQDACWSCAGFYNRRQFSMFFENTHFPMAMELIDSHVTPKVTFSNCSIYCFRLPPHWVTARSCSQRCLVNNMCQ